jgi:hypothetical protein
MRVRRRTAAACAFPEVRFFRAKTRMTPRRSNGLTGHVAPVIGTISIDVPPPWLSSSNARQADKPPAFGAAAPELAWTRGPY